MIEAIRQIHAELTRLQATALDITASVATLTASVEVHRERVEAATAAAQASSALLRDSLSGVSEQVNQVHSGLFGLKTMSSDAAGEVGEAMGRVGSAVTAGSATVKGSTTSMVSDAQAGAAHLVGVFDGMREKADSTHGHLATRLDDLADVVADHSNLWNKAVAELIDAVKNGVEPVEKLITLYGDARIGGQRLREYLAGMDLHVYQQQVQACRVDGGRGGFRSRESLFPAAFAMMPVPQS
jgi:hypothetical protein